jgi:hypothetical protein
MTSRNRSIVYGACGLAIVASLAVFTATGAKPYSRHEDEALSAMNEQSGLGDLFADAGDASGADEAAIVPSVYAFGLLPSGPGIDSLSVATISGPAFAVAAGLFWLRRRKNKQEKIPAAAMRASADAG